LWRYPLLFLLTRKADSILGHVEGSYRLDAVLTRPEHDGYCVVVCVGLIGLHMQMRPPQYIEL